MLKKIGYSSDAEAFGKVIREIVERRRPKVWRHLDTAAERDYVAWCARWAFRWASKELARREDLHP